jgi:hypothetical protein
MFVCLFVYIYLSNMPAIATEYLLVLLLFSLFTICFGLYGPSSGEIQQHHLHILKKAIDTTTDPLFYNCLFVCLMYLQSSSVSVQAIVSVYSLGFKVSMEIDAFSFTVILNPDTYRLETFSSLTHRPRFRS